MRLPSPIFRATLPHGFLMMLLAGLIALPEVQAQRQHPAAPMSLADGTTLHRALDAYDRGDTVTAQPLLRDLARRYPTSFKANEALGSLLLESGDTVPDITQALPYLNRAASLEPHQSLAHANLGAAYLKLGRGPEAVRELQLATKLEPGNASAQSNLGQAMMACAQPVLAAAAFARAAAAGRSSDPDLLYNWALALDQAGDPTQAAVILDRIPAPSVSDQAHVLAGDLDEQLGRFKEALTHYQAAAQLNPTDTNLYSLTLELLRHWTWSEALQIANFAALRYPEAIHFKVAAGIALYGDNKYPQAASAFADLLAQDPGNALYADLLGRSCSASGDIAAESCSGLQAFAEAHPRNAQAATYAATSILRRPATPKETAEAEHLLRQAVVADPTLADAFYQLAVLAQQRSQWQESAAFLEKAIALRPSYAEAHYRLSRAYAHLGRREEAQQQIALQQQFAEQEKRTLNTHLQEVVTFLTKPN